MNSTKKSDYKAKNDYRRHKRIWSFLRHFAGPFVLRYFGCKSVVAKNLPEPYIVFPNHVTDLDPALVGMSFPHQMYFVSSEHLYRLGFLSKLLLWSFAPIAKMKGASDRLTVMKVIRYLREGKNICLFPDGNRAFSGRTSKITDATGKLVKVSGANLVTYKLTGGYFTNPRWGFGIRKGKMTGNVVNVYTKEQLAAMTPEEIAEAVRKDLNENAYERQKIEHIRFKGKRLAEGMETAVCVCPVCNQVDAIGTEDNKVFCKNCGPLAEYDEYGYLVNHSSCFAFDTIEQWDIWQENFFKELVEKKSALEENTLFFCDSDIDLRIVSNNHEEQELGTGTLSIYKDYIGFKSEQSDIKIPISELPDIGVYEKTGLVFTDTKGIHYELKTKKLINVRKYIFVWQNLRQKN